MLTVTGIAKDILAQNVQSGQIRIQLCNFGNYAPRVAGTGLLARTAPVEINTAANGSFSVDIYGNNVISPGGTYYTFVFLDNRKNVVQVNAYQFTDGVNVPDLSLLAPYDPSTVVVPGPLITGAFVQLAYASPLNIDGSLGATYEVTLTGNVGNSFLTNVVPGRIYTFIIIEDGVGGWTFSWPGNVINPMAIEVTPGTINIQSFVARANGNLYPIAGMVVI